MVNTQNPTLSTIFVELTDRNVSLSYYMVVVGMSDGFEGRVMVLGKRGWPGASLAQSPDLQCLGLVSVASFCKLVALGSPPADCGSWMDEDASGNAGVSRVFNEYISEGRTSMIDGRKNVHGSRNEGH